MYEFYTAQLKAKEETLRKQEERLIDEFMQNFKLKLDTAIPSDYQQAMELSIVRPKSSNYYPHASIEYRSVTFVLEYGPFSGGEWGLRTNSEAYLAHIRSEDLLNELLVRMWKIRDSQVQPL